MSTKRLVAIGILGWFASCVAEPVTEPPTSLHSDQVSSEGKADAFGRDDRVERYELPRDGSVGRLAQASAALVPRYRLARKPDGTFFGSGPILWWDAQLCDGEHFRDQPAIAACSGTLVAEDLVLTAGHCVIGKGQSAADAKPWCRETYIVFDFAYLNHTNPTAALTMEADDVFPCAEVLVAENTDVRATAAERDYAVIRLERPVVDRTPVRLRAGRVWAKRAVQHLSGCLRYDLAPPATSIGHRRTNDLDRGHLSAAVTG